jgi:ribosomal protein S18 acetylase RimI-like enzyme
MTYSFPKDCDFRPVSLDEVPGIASQLASIWVENSPEGERPRREEFRAHREQLIKQHAHWLGFRCFTASSDDAIVGFSYGMYHGEGSGQLGEGPVSGGTHDYLQAKGVVNPKWRDSFDIADVQVLARYRGQHIGEGLIRLLCEGLPSGRVVLSVEAGNDPAIGLYTEKLQFKEAFRIPTFTSTPEAIVMSRMLPLPP